MIPRSLPGLLLALVMAAPVCASTAFVQSCSNRTFDSQTTLTCAFSMAVSSKNVVACGIFAGDQTNLDSVTDNGMGNSYSIVDTVSAADSAKGYSVYTMGIAGSPTVITATWSKATNVFHAMVCHEVAGADTIAPLDGYNGQAQTNPGAGTDVISSGALTTTANGDYVVGFLSDTQGSGGSFAAGTGFLLRDTNSVQVSSQDLVQSSPGPIAARFTAATPPTFTNTITLAMAFKPEAGETPPWLGIISSSRAIDWSAAGAGTIPARDTICQRIDPYSGTADAINAAIANCPCGQAVFLNAGTFTLSTAIDFGNKSNVTLRGNGADSTKIVFTSGVGSSNCALFGGTDVCLVTADKGDAGDGTYSNAASWSARYSAGTTSITLGSMLKGSIDNLRVGSQLFLDQLDDSADTGQVFVCSASGTCSTSGSSNNGRKADSVSTGLRGQQQIVTVTSISGSGPWTVGITPAIRMPNIVEGQAPQAWWNNGLPIQNDGIENLSFDHTASRAASGIFMLNGYNNWITGVRSVTTAQSTIHKHVWLYQSAHITVRSSYFFGAGSTSESYALDAFIGADIRFENNIFEHVAVPMMNEGCIGCVGGYNFAIDDFYTGTPVGSAPDWQQASSYHHSVGNAFILWEGNQGIGMTSDAIHGTSNFITAFRNCWNGRDPAGGSGAGKLQQTSPVILYTYSRYYNLAGNVLGTQGYHTIYETAASSGADRGSRTTANSSIFVLGYSDDEGTRGRLPNDPLTAATLMRWGNYDVATESTQWNAAEVPSDLSHFANPVPATQSLLPSFYLLAKPAWWGPAPWPAIGPDVTNGPGAGGHAYDIPSALCYANSPVDSAYGVNNVKIFNASNCYPSL